MISETSGALRVKVLNLVGYYSSTSFTSFHVRVSVVGSTREAKSHTLTKDGLENGSSHSIIRPVLSMDSAHGRRCWLKCCQTSFSNVVTSSHHMWQHCLQVPLSVLSYYCSSYTAICYAIDWNILFSDMKELCCLRGLDLGKLDCVSAYWCNENDKFWQININIQQFCSLEQLHQCVAYQGRVCGGIAHTNPRFFRAPKNIQLTIKIIRN